MVQKTRFRKIKRLHNFYMILLTPEDIIDLKLKEGYFIDISDCTIKIPEQENDLN